MIKKIFILLCMPFFAVAEETSRTVTVDRVLSVSADRPHATRSQDTIRVYVDQAEWPGTTCREDAADLLKTDEHNYSLLLMAWASGKSIKIGVDDSRRPNDRVCQVVWVQAQ